MTEQLPPEVRVKIAADVTGNECVLDEARVIIKYTTGAWLWWRPDVSLSQKDALVCAVAREISSHEERHGYRLDAQNYARERSEHFMNALTTDDVPALERLLNA